MPFKLLAAFITMRPRLKAEEWIEAAEVAIAGDAWVKDSYRTQVKRSWREIAQGLSIRGDGRTDSGELILHTGRDVRSFFLTYGELAVGR